MKTAFVKDSLREIKKTFGRFLAIFTIVAIGCGFFSGIKATMPDMLVTAEDYFMDHRLMDLKLASTLGVRSQDIEEIKKAPEVEGVMAGYSKDVYYRYESRNLVLKFMSYNSDLPESSPNKLNTPEIIEGRMPQKEGECLIEIKATSPDTFKVGNTIKISEPDGTKKITDTLAKDEYKIVGIAASPMYIGYERDSTNVGTGKVTSNVLVPEYNFKGEYYTEAYVKFKGTEEYAPFSEEYKSRVNALKKGAVKAFEESVNSRYETAYKNSLNTIKSNEEKVKTLEQIVNSDRKSLLMQKQALDLQIKQAEQKLKKSEEGSTQYFLNQTTLVQLESSLEIVADLLKDGNQQGQYHKKYKENLAENKAALEKARTELNGFKSPEIYSFNRFEASDDYSSFYGDSQKIDSISKVFPVFFILVAALVCLTTMTRMIEEQRTLMGTYKSLGYSAKTIAKKYLFYAVTASVLGSISGTVIGMKIIPAIIYDSYKIMYNIPVLKTEIKPLYVILCTAVSVVCIGAAALMACIKELRARPASLMRPRPPKNGKRVFLERFPKIWNKISFLGKVTVRNLVRYKKRFLVTVIGVAGCTALIVTGLGLKFSIKSIADRQFEDILVYNGLVMLNSDNYSKQQLAETMDEISRVDKYMFARSENVTAENSGKSQSASVIVVDKPENTEDFIHLRDCKTGEKQEIKENQAIVTEKLCKLTGLKTGDYVTLKSEKGKIAKLKIGGISKNYTMHYIYISPGTYKNCFGTESVCNMAFVNLQKGVDDTAFKEDLIKKDEFYGMEYKEDSSKGFMNSLDSLDKVVILLVVCAGGLAMVVLYNLANINITERIREIATIKVLGFFENETSAYICRENYISTAIGILVGLFLGKILHYFVVITAEVDIVMFNHQLVWWAFVLGALLTAVFTIIVNAFLRLVIRKIDMVESLKSVE